MGCTAVMPKCTVCDPMSASMQRKETRLSQKLSRVTTKLTAIADGVLVAGLRIRARTHELPITVTHGTQRAARTTEDPGSAQKR